MRVSGSVFLDKPYRLTELLEMGEHALKSVTTQ
jgi:hypothetical protein